MNKLPATESDNDDDSRQDTKAEDAFASDGPHRDLKGRTIRGGVITLASQFAQFFVYTLATVVLARLLSPQDYGLVGMVTAVTGLLRLVKDSGLSTATVQRKTITRELISTVFWINMALGTAMTVLSFALAPALVRFYREPRLYWITLATAITFFLDAVGAQHQAMLRRQMRFKALAVIDMISLVVSLVISIALALSGYGYWALVAMPIATTLTTTLGVWLVEPWRPGLPQRGSGAGSMLRFGGYLTGVNILNYSFRNVDNVLIGWYWGAGSLGLYQKAYSLLMLPIGLINSPVSAVAVTTLSRLQSDGERQRRYFLGGYSIAASIILPTVVAVVIFSDDVIRLVLGEKWTASVSIFRMLAPAALIGALLNPFGWLFISSGRGDRQFVGALIWCPLIILAFAVGLKYGPEGVAVGYSAMSALLALPLCWYAVQGTLVRLKDLASAVKYPVISGAVAGGLGVLLKVNLPQGIPVSVRAICGCLVVVCIYAFVLLVVLRQWESYRSLVRFVLPGRRSANI